jgi:hypothetical protein
VLHVAAVTPAPPALRLVGFGISALAVFLVELSLMRAVAQVTWPPFAFLALSAAMLGGGLAGTMLAIRPEWARAPELPAAGGVVIAVGSPASMIAVLLAGLEPLQVGSEVVASVVFVAVLLALALPFVGLALSLSALLVEHPGHAHRIYGADLTGAAVGSFVSVALLDALGTAAAGVLGGALGAIGALLLARGVALRTIGAAAVVGSLAFVPAAREIVPRATTDKRIGPRPTREVLAQLKASGRLYTVDGADSRVDVLPASPAPVVLIDLGAAVTQAPVFPDPSRPDDLASTSFMAKSVEGHDVLIIGSGAGYEVARALQYGAAHVDAVEVSASLLQAAIDGSIPSSKAVYGDPRVTTHLEEARSFLEQQRRADGAPRRWSHIIVAQTNHTVAVGVTATTMTLTEDFLLTREAMRAFVEHLADDGVLSMARPAEHIDLFTDLARDGLVAAGVDRLEVDRHLAVLEAGAADASFRGLLVSRRPLDRASLVAPIDASWRGPPPPTSERLPTDERPFFRRRVPHDAEKTESRGREEGPALAESAVWWVGGLSVALSLVVVVLPLWFRRRRPIVLLQSVGAARASDQAPSTSHLVIAALLGLGFMCLELSFAQRLTLLCGRPAVAFAAVVGGMLLGAGLCGLAAARWERPVSLQLALAASALGAALSIGAPQALDALGVLSLPSSGRAVIAAVVSAVLAAPLGLGFPSLIADATRRAPSAAPWLYGLNATVSVGAAALHAALAPMVGLMGTTVVATACYALGAVLAAHPRLRVAVQR